MDAQDNPVTSLAKTKFLGEEYWHWGLFVGVTLGFIYLWGRTVHYLGGDGE